MTLANDNLAYDFKDFQEEISTEYFSRDYSDYDNSTDYTPVDGAKRYTAYQIVSLLVFFVVFLLGVPGNALVIWVTRLESHKVVNAVWFQNLATADLFCCLVLPLLAVPIIQHDRWPFDNVSCRLLSCVILLNLYTSVLLLTLISLDRCMLVMKPIWCQNHRNVTLAKVACGVVWALALVLTIPAMIYRTLKEDLPGHWECVVDFEGKWQVEVGIAVSRFLFSFVGPLLIISICYVLLLNRLWSRQATRSHKTIKVVVAVVVGFFFCWTPYQIVGLLIAVSSKGSSVYRWMQHFDSLTIALAYVNSCINPVIYVVAGHGIKDRMARYSIYSLLQKVLTEDSVGRESKSFTRSTAVSEEHV
ncbi:C5a anaphylatoxin chemotactic receptor 1 [Gracilinanus agilis]|uniref:C5a anaphylatoxin chemotactic receptor 1 n=1 Tax=Gracilinanus agilis TaxID=191870 RepID=UPI001CFE0A5E|nr:C5a anaphylatoxin chemotactic receptor 1 [Gracilinanus agilis]